MNKLYFGPAEADLQRSAQDFAARRKAQSAALRADPALAEQRLKALTGNRATTAQPAISGLTRLTNAVKGAIPSVDPTKAAKFVRHTKIGGGALTAASEGLNYANVANDPRATLGDKINQGARGLLQTGATVVGAGLGSVAGPVGTLAGAALLPTATQYLTNKAFGESPAERLARLPAPGGQRPAATRASPPGPQTPTFNWQRNAQAPRQPLAATTAAVAARPPVSPSRIVNTPTARGVFLPEPVVRPGEEALPRSASGYVLRPGGDPAAAYNRAADARSVARDPTLVPLPQDGAVSTLVSPRLVRLDSGTQSYGEFAGALGQNRRAIAEAQRQNDTIEQAARIASGLRAQDRADIMAQSGLVKDAADIGTQSLQAEQTALENAKASGALTDRERVRGLYNDEIATEQQAGDTARARALFSEQQAALEGRLGTLRPPEARADFKLAQLDQGVGENGLPLPKKPVLYDARTGQLTDLNASQPPGSTATAGPDISQYSDRDIADTAKAMGKTQAQVIRALRNAQRYNWSQDKTRQYLEAL